MPKDPELLAHQQWLGYLQPVGLVVSPPALVSAQAFVNMNVAAEQARFLTHLHSVPVGQAEPVSAIRSLKALLTDPGLFGWKESDLVAVDDPRAKNLEVVLTEYHETLKPTFAVPDGPGWLMLIQEWPLRTDLDRDSAEGTRHWQASPQARFERLLRETGVPIGLLFNSAQLRLVYYPRGESAGHVTFPVVAMSDVAGRPVLAALLMLLGADRLFTLPDRQRLPALLSESRRYQNTVSTELAEQVLAALFELVRGFQAADDQRKGELLRDVLAHEPDQVYAGLVTVLMRLVFLLYADDRGLMSEDEVYIRFYSVTGLFERLREDAGRYPDTMDHRYGAWAQLLALFRLVHDGGGHGKFRLPARHGYLFSPDRYPFLEGRPRGHRRVPGARIEPPLVSDGVLFRALSNLLILSGDRLSYAHLDVEHIGSVYESIMGYRLEKSAGRSIAIEAKKAHGAPVTINLDELLEQKPADRSKWLKEHADQTADGKALSALKEAKKVEDLVAALERKIARSLTPNIVPPGAIVLQPSDERRRSGSHYTPRTMTGPIVRKALEPVLKQLGDNPTPEQILALKVCDQAVGSGAFLVESCRQLGEALLKAWISHKQMPKVPDDETPELLAQRAIAQRCLYGVDKNSMAVDLAKLSLWLVTLAKKHPFTFLDHALRCGDSLVGLGREQIRRFHWKHGQQQMVTGFEEVLKRIDSATKSRQEILDAGDEGTFGLKEQKLADAEGALNLVRFAGNLAVAAFFAGDKDKQRNDIRDDYFGRIGEYLRTGNMALRPTKEEAALHEGPHPVQPFHWEIEFPEVFTASIRRLPGFDVFVGNPPFAGKNTITAGNRDGYLDWLKALHEDSHGNADLVAHFFRRAFNLLRPGGTFGLIATNTIAQGDTRGTGLRWVCTHGGTIYSAHRRYKWPGQAAVVVSVVHIAKGPLAGPFDLDGKPVERITAYLFHAGGHDDPATLSVNNGIGLKGPEIGSLGFLLSESVREFNELKNIIDPRDSNAKLLKLYLGGEDLNDGPLPTSDRFILDVDGLRAEQLPEGDTPLHLLEERVRTDFLARGEIKKDTAQWWNFRRPADELRKLWRARSAVLCVARVSQTFAFTFIPAGVFANEKIVLFHLHTPSAFALLQSRPHEIWARFFSATMKDDLQYALTDCFETFPFPANFETHPALEAAGKEYYEYRAGLMVTNNEGLTKTYNRFHDPAETAPEIQKLRALHDAMDRAVLAAYGDDLGNLTPPPCAFLLDYVEDEDEDVPAKKKKPWRYRWPDEFRDEVLARLLELNKQRAEMEKLNATHVRRKFGGEIAHEGLGYVMEEEGEKSVKPKGPKKIAITGSGDVTHKKPGPALFDDVPDDAATITGTVGPGAGRQPFKIDDLRPGPDGTLGTAGDISLEPPDDEPFKSVQEGDVGPHWGIFNSDLTLKPGTKGIFDEATVPDRRSESLAPSESNSTDAGQISPAVLEERLDAIAPYADGIRTFDCTGDLQSASEIIRSLGKSPMIDAWVVGNEVIPGGNGPSPQANSPPAAVNDAANNVPIPEGGVIALGHSSATIDLSKNYWGLTPENSGVLIDKAATLVDSSIKDISGASFDPLTQQLVFLGSSGPAAVHDVDLSLFTSAIQTVYGSATPPLITIDPLAKPDALPRPPELMPIGSVDSSQQRYVHSPFGAKVAVSPASSFRVADLVQCAVFAPPEATRGSGVLIQAFAFKIGQSAEAEKLATEFEPDATRRMLTTLSATIGRGQAIQFQLRMPFPVDPKEAELVWQGETAGVQFEVAIPKKQPMGDVFGTMIMTVEGAPVGQMKFKLTITKGRKKAKPAEPVLAAQHESSRFRQPFISYSSKDRDFVERAVGLLALMGIDYFQDVRNLRPGEPWKPQLDSAIDTCDLFLLFWSSNASASPHVKDEIQRTFARLGPDGTPPPVIWPYAIEDPPIPSPPDELRKLHFGHYRYLRPTPPKEPR